MRLPKDSKIGVALSVLRKLQVRAKDVDVSTYSNCREQGFFVTFYGKDYSKRRAVSFAENRNSDNIIVQFGNITYGKDSDFNDYGVLSEEAYNKGQKKYFDCGDSDGAAKFATKWLKG